MLLRQIFDPKLAQYAYLIGCQRTREAILVDPQRDVDRYVALAATEGLRISAVTETHIHADFLSGARELAERTGARLYLSDEGDADWKYRWPADDGCEVTPLRHGDSLRIGHIELRVLHTPGHTPEHLAFLVIDHGGGAAEPMGIASGDFVFVGDLGRPDLLESAAGMAGAMEPSARQLYRSLDAFLELPDFLQVWPGHGAGSACGKALGAVPMSTVGYERRYNAAIRVAARGEGPFVASILEGQPEPPPYFARMKRLNRDGVPSLSTLPEPEPRSAASLPALARQAGTVILDTRIDRAAFLRGHVAGSLFAPLNKSFPTVVGSYVEPQDEIVLVVDPARIEEAVRDLVRIGYDRVVGHVAPAELEALPGLVATRVLDFAAVAELVGTGEVVFVDVRGAAEHAAGHVPGSLNVAHTRLAPRLDEVPSDREVVVYCQTGARAAVAAALLERRDRAVSCVVDDFERWAG